MKIKKIRLALVDTMFARVDMGSIAIDEINKNYNNVEIIRSTVPGIKDLAVECKKLLAQCDVALALGMVGSAPIDVQCAHEASLAIQQAKLLTNKHIIEVFVHENEAWSENELLDIFDQRIRKHAHNAVLLVSDPQALIAQAGQGIRQGKENEGLLNDKRIIGIGFVVSEFNNEITEEMIEQAKKTVGTNAEVIDIINVPGAFDAPLAVKKLLMNKKIDCVAVLGTVVKGETKHDEVIVFNIANKLIELSLEFNKPVTLGIIGPGVTWKQATARAASYAKHATETAIKMTLRLKR